MSYYNIKFADGDPHFGLDLHEVKNVTCRQSCLFDRINADIRGFPPGLPTAALLRRIVELLALARW